MDDNTLPLQRDDSYSLDLLENVSQIQVYDQATPTPLSVCNCSNLTGSTQIQDSQPIIKLLSWTVFNAKSHGDTENWFPSGFEECKEYFGETWTPCEYTWKKSQLKTSDVVLFRARRTDIKHLPNYRSPDQKWLFFEFEPPYKVWTHLNLTLVRDLFNVTSTYSRDSDIPKVNYIKKCHYDPGKVVSSNSTKDFAAQKEGLVAWFVSVCYSQSGRFNYVKELQRYIQVDIYGRCGPNKCGSATVKTWKKDQCEKKLLHGDGSYKFYLAFENSLCDDYISEKLWKLDRLDVVPIVMGMADYSNMRPRDTFIDVRDFKSPMALAKYLLHLDKHNDLYNQYIHNIRALRCRKLIVQAPHHCMICKHFQENRDKQEVVYDIAKFWGMRRCRRPEEFLSFTRDDEFTLDNQQTLQSAVNVSQDT